MALDDMLADPDTARLLPNRMWDILHGITEQLSALQGALQDKAEDVSQGAHDGN